jgi:hypothetical protein
MLFLIIILFWCCAYLYKGKLVTVKPSKPAGDISTTSIAKTLFSSILRQCHISYLKFCNFVNLRNIGTTYFKFANLYTERAVLEVTL